MDYVIPALGAAISLAGIDKLAGLRGYNEMFRHLGWSRCGMQAAAAAETAGGLLMVPLPTRRFGGAVIAAVSGIVLVSELRRGNAKLAAPRTLVLAAGLCALLGRVIE